ncbi:MAG: cell envelope integrity protein TolA [Oxalobacteraceae bacterium]|nr:cell envelope integrity protein TolA [Oxalobacteraceae bacterium]
MNASTPYFVPQEPGRWRAIALAAVVHAALFAFLWIGIRWQNEKPLTVEAEIWSPSTQEAAPLAAQKIPEPLLEQPPEKVFEKPAPLPEPRPVIATPLLAKPDIALEQEKKRKARQEQQERLAEEQRQAKALQQKEDQERLKRQKIANEKLAEKEKAEYLTKKKREAEEASKIAAAAQDKKRKQELAKQAALAAEDEKLAKLREENLRRMTGDSSGGAGTAAKSQGNRGDPSYGERIKAKIKSNTIFNVPASLDGNPAAEYEVSLLPDGTIRSMRLKKSSGVAGFDEAVKRGIEKSEPYPKDKSGEVPPSFDLIYKPKD